MNNFATVPQLKSLEKPLNAMQPCGLLPAWLKNEKQIGAIVINSNNYANP